jgi:hypothetical protein
MRASNLTTQIFLTTYSTIAAQNIKTTSIDQRSLCLQNSSSKMAYHFFRNLFTITSPPPKPTSKPALSPKREITRCNAKDPSTTTGLLVSILERDGGVIVENLISTELAAQIKSDLKPYFDTDKVDASGFFPHTTQRATGLLAKSDACVELALNPIYIDVANQMISATYTYWSGQKQETVTAKPVISSTVGFRVNPSGKQQGLHRDDSYAYPVCC